MGMFDTVSGALDTASQMLAGGSATPGTAAGDAALTFLRGKNLDAESATESAGQAPNLENALNGYPVIEFIHFGYVHTSHSNFFTHDDYSDREKNDQVQEGDRPRAIQFRSALEREAILLSVFMECTQTVLQEREDSSAMGGLGSALNTMGSLLGAGGGGSGKTTPSDLNSHIQKVVAAIAPVLPDSIEYKNTHQAGIDLHQARLNYRKLLQTLVEEKPTADPASSLLSKLPSVGGIAGPFANILTFTQGVAFKAQDVKAKFFVLAAQQQEPQVETACNTMTLAAINNLANPFLPVWFNAEKPKNETWDNAPANPLAGSYGNIGDLLMSPVIGATDKLRQDVIDQGNEVKKFFEHPPEVPPPGTDPLGVAFKNPPELKGKTTFVPMAMGDVASRAFITALGMKPPLGMPETIVSGIVGVALEFTEAVYKSILIRDPGGVIDGDALLAGAREEFNFGKRLEDLAVSKLSFISDAKKWETPSVGGFQVRPGDLADKGVDKLDDLVEEKIRPVVDPILAYAMKTMADQLELGRQNGLNNTCHTMEWYLGRLPWVQATLFCNLFFPFWNALMRAVADLLGGPVGGALKSIVDVADKAKGVTDTARNALVKADAIRQAASDTSDDFGSFNESNLFTKAGAAADRFNQAAKKKAAQTTGPTLDQGKFVIPVTGRSEQGQGVKIEKPAYDEVASSHKWDDATDPDVKADDQDNAGAKGGDAATVPPTANP